MIIPESDVVSEESEFPPSDHSDEHSQDKKQEEIFNKIGFKQSPLQRRQTELDFEASKIDLQRIFEGALELRNEMS